ncbi:MAG: rhodanese-like domain-containing protein [Desulfonatronospira sp. MSAO_Bac3]|nr:MAG: rhodanese-like domain-containing protein [Desulfonatronospira sp. MSAO_Bac3]
MINKVSGKSLSILALVLFLFLAGGCLNKEPATQAGYQPGQPIPSVEVEVDVPNPFHTYVDAYFVKSIVCDNLIQEEPRDDVLLIDSRPKRPRYDRGHIPSAVSLPDSEFEEKADQVLPDDKSVLLLFHCQDTACRLSHDSAWKAEEMGYENVVVYPEGNADWEDRGFKTWTIDDITEPDEADVAAKERAEEPSEPSDIKEGDFPGSIEEEFFKEVLATDPDSIQLIDVREEDEFEKGHIPGAVRMNVAEIREAMDDFDTSEKPIVLICATGARSGEAYFTFDDLRPELDVYYLDASISYKDDGSYEID